MRLLSKSTRRNNLDHTNVFFVQSEEYKKQMLEKYGAGKRVPVHILERFLGMTICIVYAGECEDNR
jgi:hypothetical protein